MAFYENYIKLCNSVGKSPSAVAVELKLGKPSVTRWKNGAEPRDATLQKIADHFGVTVDFLKGEEQTNFYMRYCELCANKGMSASGVASAIGLSNAAANGWKKGKLPNDTTLAKLSAYFGVTVEYLKGEETKNAPMPNDIGEENILRMYRSLSTEEKGALYTYALSLKEKQKEGK